ncbi:MAG TPA: 4Fe-4S dicluster domain-containing protein [Verrucomicrobiaceae bacterium]|jgi:molybdopterin-containing oxidoreductase family iron-sulfur binding subunit
MSASLFMMGAAGCTKQPREEIIPYVRQPEDLIPGNPRWFATAMDVGGHAQGLLVRSDEGRPTKIEGNPDHPQSMGRSSVLLQAALLDLYDPDRSKMVRRESVTSTWEEFLAELQPRLAAWKQNRGVGLRVLVGRRSSPTLQEQMGMLLEKFPGARWVRYDAAFPENPRPMACDFDRAKIVLSLDADFLGSADSAPREIRAFTVHRRDASNMNQLYVVESMPSLTGAMADHRRAMSPSEIEMFAVDLATALKNDHAPGDSWSSAVFRALRSHRGASAVMAGRFQSRRVHQAVFQMNQALENIGSAVRYDAAEPKWSGLDDLADEMTRGAVDALIMIGVNPVFTAPGDMPFADILGNVPFTVHLGLYEDETASHCRWHIPESHFLESWSDAMAVDGMHSVVQPLIEPLYPTKSAHELLAAFLEEVPATGYDIVREAWKRRHPKNESEFGSWWRKVLHDGVALVARPVPAATVTTEDDRSPAMTRAASLELIIRPDPHLLDGRHADNAWLQELPKPLSRLAWGNGAFLSAATAGELHLSHGEVVELKRGSGLVEAPVFVLPGHADRCVTVHLGHGRSRAGRVGNGVGFNAALLQTRREPWGGAGLEIRSTGKAHFFATTHDHQRMEGRDLVRVQGAAEALPPPSELSGSLYPPVNFQRPSWGMVIDLSTCIGCGACTIACQAENNIPVVGPEQVKRGREMHWIRVDRYFSGPDSAPQILHQPVPCMHCENAPCELVCPVGATLHDHQGLNLMVYNRCVGTRYCSNNCPYKVRRFNFLQFTDQTTPQFKLMRNPDVTVRMRGVMEKCTYCVQRISAARIAADKETREIRDGEVVPACVQACPADAMVFGDILDQESRVSRERKSPRHYRLLEELNTRPRTTYLAKLRNPNREIPA